MVLASTTVGPDPDDRVCESRPSHSLLKEERGVLDGVLLSSCLWIFSVTT